MENKLVTSALDDKDNDDTWSGEQYHKHSASQWETASSLLQKLSLQKNDNILDIGCGDGKITAILAEQAPEGSVVGVDVSPSMIEFAAKTFANQKNLDFQLMDAQALQFNSFFDKVVSFTAFHWIPNKRALIEGIWQSLKSKGNLAFSVPIAPPESFVQAIKETIEEHQWKAYFQGFQPNWSFISAKEFKNIIEQTHFDINHWGLVLQEDIYPNLTDFKSYVLQWLPHLKPLPKELQNSFLDQIIANYLKHININTEIKIRYSFYCLEVIAQKT